LVRAPRDAASSRSAIRETAWQRAGILRDADNLEAGLSILREIEAEWQLSEAPSIEQMETANLLTVAQLVMRSALVREESRGAHYRTDFPTRRDPDLALHSWVGLNRQPQIATGRL
jgi:L-aspartate oxidase